MNDRNRRPTRLSELLPRLAREQGAGRLAPVALEAAVRGELGDWLGRRLLSCRRSQDRLELEIAGEAAAREVEALAPELIEKLRRRLGPSAPSRLEVSAGPAPRPRRSPAKSDPEEPPALPGPELRKALEEVEDPRLRAQLARVAARSRSGPA